MVYDISKDAYVPVRTVKVDPNNNNNIIVFIETQSNLDKVLNELDRFEA